MIVSIGVLQQCKFVANKKVKLAIKLDWLLDI